MEEYFRFEKESAIFLVKSLKTSSNPRVRGLSILASLADQICCAKVKILALKEICSRNSSTSDPFELCTIFDLPKSI
jgi:hypothetical protein